MRIANSSFEGAENIFKNFNVSKFKKSLEKGETQFDFMEKMDIDKHKNIAFFLFIYSSFEKFKLDILRYMIASSKDFQKKILQQIIKYKKEETLLEIDQFGISGKKKKIDALVKATEIIKRQMKSANEFEKIMYDIKIDDNFKVLINEINQRRNLLAHRDDLTDSQYVNNIKYLFNYIYQGKQREDESRKFSDFLINSLRSFRYPRTKDKVKQKKEIETGKEVIISTKYLLHVIILFYEYSIKIYTGCILKTKSKVIIQELTEDLSDSIHNILIEDKIGYFGRFSSSIRKLSNVEKLIGKNYLTVNIALYLERLALDLEKKIINLKKNKNTNNEKIKNNVEVLKKLIKDIKKTFEGFINLLEKTPNIKDDDDYAFALACLKKNNDQALEIFNKNKQNKISFKDANNWYIFKRFHKNKKFKEIFKRKSGYTFKSI